MDKHKACAGTLPEVSAIVPMQGAHGLICCYCGEPLIPAQVGLRSIEIDLRIRVTKEDVAGCGGADAGLYDAAAELGIEVQVVAAFDSWGKAVEIYNANMPHPVAQVCDLKTLQRADLPPHDLVIGGPPCQDHSVAGKRARRWSKSHREQLWQLIESGFDGVWDGNVISKSHRNDLIRAGYAVRNGHGVTFSTPKGQRALAAGEIDERR